MPRLSIAARDRDYHHLHIPPMILSALFILAVAVEMFLLVGKDYVLDTRRRTALEASIRQAHDDLKEAKKRIDAGRARLVAAIDEAEARRADMLEADKAFARSQKVMPVLVHALGALDSGVCFRARLSKELPSQPEPSQQLIWNCQNVVECWAADAATAAHMISKQFQFKQGYDVGELVAQDSAASAPVREIAA